MRIVLDYGGVIVEHGGFDEEARILGAETTDERRAVALAYFAFRDGFVQSTEEYLTLLETLTGASEAACREYLNSRWLDPEFPEEHAQTLRALADDHTLVSLSNMVKPWIETVLATRDTLQLFDKLVVSSEIRRAKPHPRGYLACLPDDDDEPVVMVSDEYNEDLLMAETLGMDSVWVEQPDETPYREPDSRIQSLTELPDVLSADGVADSSHLD